MPPPAAAAPPPPAPAPLAPPLAHILRRKPIYPPLPTNPFYLSDSGDSGDEEVLCPNSSETEDDCDGDDDASRQRSRQRRRAKKERILKLAERYINGEQLYIHCATLRGPVVVSPWRKEKKASADTTTTAATVKEGGRKNGSMMTAGTTPAPQAATIGNSALAVTAKLSPKSPREPKLKAYFSARKSVTTINGVTPKTTGSKEKTTVVTVDVCARRARSEAPTTLTERSRRDEELVPDTSFESFSMSQPATMRHVNTTRRARRDEVGEDMDGDMGNGMEDVSFDETPIGVDIAVRWIGRRELEKNNDKAWSRVRMVDGSGNGVQNGARRSQSPAVAAYASEQQDKAEPIQAPAVTNKRKRVQLGSPDRGRHVPQTSEEPGTAIDTTNANGADSTTAASEVDWSKKRPRIDFMNLSTPPLVTPVQPISRGDSGPKRRRTEPTPAELKEIQTGSTNARAPPVRSPSHMAELEAIRVNAVKSFLEETELPDTKQVTAGDRAIEKENIETVPKRSRPRKEPVLPNVPDISCDGNGAAKASVHVPNTPEPPSPSQKLVGESTPLKASSAQSLPAPAPAPETPWQGTQINLLAAQNDFFKAMADSPLRFDSPEHPAPAVSNARLPATGAGTGAPTPARAIPDLPTAALTPINQNVFSASFLAHSSSPPPPKETQAADTPWGKVLRTPAPRTQFSISSIINPTSANVVNPAALESAPANPAPHPETSAPPQLPPLPFGGSSKLVPSPTPNNTILTTEPDTNQDELTPFRAFRTPSPPPSRPRGTGGLRFAMSPPPAGAASKTYSTAENDNNATKKSVGFAASFALDSTLEDTQLDSTIADEITPDRNAMGMGMQGLDRQADNSTAGKWGFSPTQEDEETSLVKEVAGFLGADRWDIDEELRKMAGTGNGKDTPTSGTGRRRRGGDDRRRVQW